MTDGDDFFEELPYQQRQAVAREVQWARREADAQAGLANERAHDLMERLRRLSHALQQRGDDMLAAGVDSYQPHLQQLVVDLRMLEGVGHNQERIGAVKPS